MQEAKHHHARDTSAATHSPPVCGAARCICAGDYDGDQFFVCWDERLIPSKHQLQQPLDYSADADPAAPAAAAVDHQALIEYFAQYDPFILGRLNS